MVTVQFLASLEMVSANVKDSVAQANQAVDATKPGTRGSLDAGERMARINQSAGRTSSTVTFPQVAL